MRDSDIRQSDPAAAARWSAFKERLAVRSPWLRPLIPTLQSLIAEEISRRPIETRPYDPFLFDSLLKESIELTNKCLIYRRDAQDLEIQAVRSAAEFEKFFELLSLNEESEKFALSINRLRAEVEGALAAAQQYREDGSALTQGLARDASGRATAGTIAVNDALLQEQRISAKWKTMERFEHDAQQRFFEPDGSHNFADRLRRIVRFLAEDLQEAICKAEACFRGIRGLFDRNFEVPDVLDQGSIDSLAVELRAASRFLQAESMADSDYELVIPFAQPWIESSGQVRSLADREQVVAALLGGPPLVVDLTDVFQGQELVRLRTVGLSFASELATDILNAAQVTQVSAHRLRAMLLLPPQSFGGGFSVRPPILFGNVAAYSGTAPLASYSGASVNNVSPKGSWTISFSPNAVYFNNLGRTLEEYQSNLDIKLHLGIRAKLGPQTSLPGFSE
jgi:hypothetical protein